MDNKIQIHGAVSRHLSDVAGQLALFLEKILPANLRRLVEQIRCKYPVVSTKKTAGTTQYHNPGWAWILPGYFMFWIRIGTRYHPAWT
ncbi:MAG: hypothetical protein U5R30_14380 [Deltaproteobacteria bacterium]|nr:hypothetical protein [Deltaproteobacteria bacterium]